LWLPKLFDLPGFREAIDWSPERDWVDALIKRMVELLSRPGMHVLRALLAKELQVSFTDSARLAREWIARSAPIFVRTANRVGHALIGDGSDRRIEQADAMAAMLEEIVEAGLAGKLGVALLSRVVLRSRADAGEDFVHLPCMEIVLAEFYSAGLDGRPGAVGEVPPDQHNGEEALWKDLRREYPVWPHLCVPLNPALGYGVDPMDWAKTALLHLACALGIPERRRSQETPEQIAETVNTKIETLARPDQPVPKRWYLVYFEGQDLAPALALRKLLPQLRICTMRRSEDSEERKQEDELSTEMSQFLERKRKRANRR
jgi:hypothetical protein